LYDDAKARTAAPAAAAAADVNGSCTARVACFAKNTHTKWITCKVMQDDRLNPAFEL
jgi:hypothetical protein